MTPQPEDDYPLFRRADPDTSRAAGLAVAPHLSALQARVLDAYTEHGPMTDRECETLDRFASSVAPSTVRKRITELLRKGELEPVGVRDRGRVCRVAGGGSRG